MSVRKTKSHLRISTFLCVLFHAATVWSETGAAKTFLEEKVIIDTDIGDDIDDAFALALALQSPELHILQINSDYGDTELRTRLLDRFLGAVGKKNIPVATGVRTEVDANHFSQWRYAEREPADLAIRIDAVTSTLAQIHKYPGEITLIAIGPSVNVGAMIDRDPTTFHQLKRVVMMGGSLYRNRDDLSSRQPREIVPEWNIVQDISGAQKLFASGVAIYMLPLDATRLKLDEVKREALFRQGTRLTDQLTLLYHQWGWLTPVLFDAMAVGFAINPALCPTKPLNILVDAKGITRVGSGAPNAFVCLQSDQDKFFDFYLDRVLKPEND